MVTFRHLFAVRPLVRRTVTKTTIAMYLQTMLQQQCLCVCKWVVNKCAAIITTITTKYMQNSPPTPKHPFCWCNSAREDNPTCWYCVVWETLDKGRRESWRTHTAGQCRAADSNSGSSSQGHNTHTDTPHPLNLESSLIIWKKDSILLIKANLQQRNKQVAIYSKKRMRKKERCREAGSEHGKTNR